MKTKISTFLLLFVAGLVVGTALVPRLRAADKLPPSHVVTLSLQRIIAESAEGRAANQRLQALGQKMAADLAAKQKELQQPQAGATAESRQKMFQQLVQQSQAEFANTQRQVQNELRTKINPILSQVAADRGADMVLNGDAAVAWAGPGLDITNDVLAKLNAATPPK